MLRQKSSRRGGERGDDAEAQDRKNAGSVVGDYAAGVFLNCRREDSEAGSVHLAGRLLRKTAVILRRRTSSLPGMDAAWQTTSISWGSLALI